ncbi:hypothetical protein [Enterococcus casseliflavus]|uniref:hypothetical protein n=1 Tax=Enterococcus casseliflavus TaxID=37734 RepID=UPI00115F4E69|nr:hypothetical protein [Enterococcus casseliflavus]
MSLITDLFVLSKMKERKLKENRERNARATKSAYDIGKNYINKQAEQSRIKRDQVLEEEELRSLINSDPNEISKFNIAFFDNYPYKIDYYYEKNSYFEALLLMNEALFRIKNVEGNHFSRVVQQNNPIFSFFDENSKMSEDFIALLFNTVVNFDLSDDYKENWLSDYHYDFWLIISDNKQIRKAYQSKINFINNIILELSVLESILRIEPVQQVLIRNFNKIYSFEISLYSYQTLLESQFDENYDDYYINILKKELDSSFTFNEVDNMRITYDVLKDNIINTLMLKASPVIDRWEKVIKKYNIFQKKIQDMMYYNGFDKNYVLELIKYFHDEFGFNPYTIQINKSEGDYNYIEAPEMLTAMKKFSRKSENFIYIAESHSFKIIFKLIEDLQPLMRQEEELAKEEERLSKMMDDAFREKMDIYNYKRRKSEISKLLTVLNKII